MATIDELRARAELIAEEQQIGGNTADRVGDAFDMVADIIEAVAPGDQQAVLYNPQSPNEAQKAQARENIGAQETISDIADFVKVSAQTFTAAQKQQARENIGAEQAGGAVKNLAGSASDTETLIKAANNPNLQANIHLSGNNIYVNGIAGGIDLDNNGVDLKAGNSGYPNAKVKVNGQDVATKLYVDGKVDDRADPIEVALAAIEAVIPSQASAQNQLADKAFVNSSISSSTANFVGTFASLAELQAVQGATNNDYGFIVETDAVGNEYYDRYKYNGTSWLFEYKVESTPFTADQWAAIQSGITSALVTKLSALPTNQELTTSLNAKADKSDTYTKQEVDAAIAAIDVSSQIAGKADKVANAVNGDFAALDANGNLADSGKKAADFALQSNTYTKAEIGNLITPIDSEVIVGALPATGVANKVYRVPGTDSYTDYGWDGTQFVPLATYTGSPVSGDDLAYLDARKAGISFTNLFDKDSQLIKSGVFINASGYVSVNRYSISHPIPIVSGTTYKVLYPSGLGANNNNIARCDSEGNLISVFTGTISDGYLTFTPSFDGFIAVNLGYDAALGSVMVCASSDYPDCYVPYRPRVGDGYRLGAAMESQVEDMISASGIDELKNQFSHHKSANLFDKSDPLSLAGFWFNGAFYANARYRVTQPIKAKAGVEYKTIAPEGLGTSNKMVAVVDLENNIIGSIQGELIDGYFIATPGEDCLLSFNIGNATGAADSAMVCESSQYPSDYVGYYDYYELLTNVSKLAGKSVIFTGDSICAATTDDQGGWAGRIGNANDMTWQNKGTNGGTITDKTLTGSSFTIATTDFGDGADYIILEGGTNDADRIGSILGGNVPELYGSWNETNYTTQFGISTFCDAVQHLIQTVVTTYPNARVGFIIAPKMGVTNSGYTPTTNNRRAYFETINQICNKWGVPVLNLWDECTLNPRLASHYTSGESYMYVDGQHLTPNGYAMISPIIQAWMEKL